MAPRLRVLELYCGIGGMHFALERLGQPYEVVAAMELNATVLETYSYNFPETMACNRNIVSLSAEEINLLNIDMIVMSPPCQPFCRVGLQKDTSDARTDSLCHLLNILPDVQFNYILLENVKGFETSDAHSLLLRCLRKCGFEWQEFLISPTSVGIPNSRLRYYLSGKKAGLPWSFKHSEDILTNIPDWSETLEEETAYGTVVQTERKLWEERRRQVSTMTEFTNSAYCVKDIIENEVNYTENATKTKVLFEKYYQVMDIVDIDATNTCCFTKSYGTFVKGTGSILEDNSFRTEVSADAERVKKLRFFTPREVARLMCFPDSFKFPPHLSIKLQYKGLGNSINVFVVSILLSLLIGDKRPNR